MIVCPTCGGTFADTAEKCPYCGMIHLSGATAAYNQKLDQLNDDLADLADDAAVEYEQTLQNHGKRVFRIVAISIALLGILALGFFLLMRSADPDPDEMKERFLWEQETFAQLDAWYAQGDLSAILEFEDALWADETNDYSIYNWKHHNVLVAYRTYDMYLYDQAHLAETGYLDPYDLVDLLGFVLESYTDAPYLDCNEQDLAAIATYQQEISVFVQEQLDMSEADLEALAQELLKEDNWISYMECCDYVEQHYTEQ